MTITSNNTLLFSLLNKYELSSVEKEELLSVIESIFIHDEFQRRMSKDFLHHDQITLGEHILEVTICTYILSKKYRGKKDFDLNSALKVAMFHDLYSQPWQNNPNGSVNKRSNKHAFRHPIESVINSSIWFPEIFDKKENIEIITDGVVHHMFPLPVASFVDSNSNLLELRNFDYIPNINPMVKEALINSSGKSMLRNFSFTPSIYSEGRVVSGADKIVAINNLKGSNISAIKALITGKNDNLEKGKIKVLKND